MPSPMSCFASRHVLYIRIPSIVSRHAPHVARLRKVSCKGLRGDIPFGHVVLFTKALAAGKGEMIASPFPYLVSHRDYGLELRKLLPVQRYFVVREIPHSPSSSIPGYARNIWYLADDYSPISVHPRSEGNTSTGKPGRQDAAARIVGSARSGSSAWGKPS
jgi:hypothetical protein